MFNHNYPYTDMHELNLDWILNEIIKQSLNIKSIDDALKMLESIILNRITSKKIMLFTDSYGTDIFTTENFCKLLKNKIGENFNYIATGASGFTIKGLSGKDWIDDIAGLPQDNNLTDFYVVGGGNDRYSVESDDGLFFKSRFNDFYLLFKEKFPYAKLHLLYCVRQITPDAFANNVLRCRMVDLYTEIAAKYNDIEFFNGINWILYPNALGSDHLHPTEKGEVDLFRGVLFNMKGFNYIKPFTQTIWPNQLLDDSNAQIKNVLNGMEIKGEYPILSINIYPDINTLGLPDFRVADITNVPDTFNTFGGNDSVLNMGTFSDNVLLTTTQFQPLEVEIVIKKINSSDWCSGRMDIHVTNKNIQCIIRAFINGAYLSKNEIETILIRPTTIIRSLANMQ